VNGLRHGRNHGAGKVLLFDAMPGPDTSPPRPHVRGARIATLLYLLTVVLVPLVHANTERLGEAMAFESHHTAQCFPIHNEALCPTCGSHRIVITRVSTHLPAYSRALRVPFRILGHVAPPTPDISPPGTRASPLR
jgi:hypothetical protein